MDNTISVTRVVERAIDKSRDLDSVTGHQAAQTYLALARIMDNSLNNERSISQAQEKALRYICDLIDKNFTVFKSGLISGKEYNVNGEKLFNKLVSKLNVIIRPKTEKASKMDVYSLRAGIETLNHEN